MKIVRFFGSPFGDKRGLRLSPRLITVTRTRLFLLSFCISFILIYLYFPYPHLSPTTSIPTSRHLPVEYWRHRREHSEAYKSPSCVDVPRQQDIEYAAAFWQHLGLVNGSLYMYSAYWDGRFEEPLVRILVYTDVGNLPKLYCQLWYFHESAPQVVVAQSTYTWRPEWLGPTAGVNEPYILSCNPTFHHHHPHRKNAPPAAVSVVTRPCERAANVLKVQNAPSPAQPPSTPLSTSVAVCLKWLDYEEDISAQILEWLLLLKYFEAEAVYIYLVRAHHNVLRVLNHFESIGFVRLTDLAHPPWLEGPGNVRKWARWQRDLLDMRRETLSLNDCLYRAIGHHSWLATLDIDEIIVPISCALYHGCEDFPVRQTEWPVSWSPAANARSALHISSLVNARVSESGNPLVIWSRRGIKLGDLTYPRLLTRKLSLPVDAVTCRNVYYIAAAQKDLQAPPFARMLAHTWRTKETSDYGHHVKSFHNVETVVAIHNHLPLVCHHRSSCEYRYLDAAAARLQHYRSECPTTRYNEACYNPKEVVREATLEAWRHSLLEDIPKTLAKLGLPVPGTAPKT